MYFAINYGNVLRWQIRAQNNADSAAQSIAALQANTWNEMNELLYASDVEEYRARKLLDNIVNITHNSGGCIPAPDTSANGCLHAYDVLEPLFAGSVYRYTSDILALQGVSQQATFSNLYWGPPGTGVDCTQSTQPTSTCSDAYRVIAQLNNGHNAPSCEVHNPASPNFGPVNGDCGFQYSIVSVKKRGGLLAASEDAFNTGTPEGGSGGYSHHLTFQCPQGVPPPQILPASVPTTCSNAATGGALYYIGTGVSTFYVNDEFFAPAEVEVAVCAVVPPIIPNFLGLKPPTQYAIARAAATNVMVEQDWLQPGEFQRGYNSVGTTTKYQDPEAFSYLINSAGGLGNTYLSFYDLTFGGLDYYDTSGGVHKWNQSGPSGNDFETLAGWWAPIPVAPFAGTVAQNTIFTTGAGCTAART
jgi:hypothetical protein